MLKQIIVLTTVLLVISFSLKAQNFEHILPSLPALQLDADILLEGKPYLFDYDNDEDVDVLINDRIYVNEGDAFFENYVELGFPPESSDYAHAFDADNDGDLDLLIPVGEIGTADHLIKLFINDGTGSFTEQIPALFGGVDCDIETGDVDNDGDIDIFATNVFLPSEPYPTTALFLNNGDNSFTVQETDIVDVFIGQVILSYLDDDDDLDVIVVGKPNGGGNVLRTYRNDGNAHFTQYMSGLPNLKDMVVETNDIDNDGDQDVVITGVEITTAKSQVFKNNGNGIFTLHQHLNGVSRSIMTTFGGIDLAGSISFGDIDNDGDHDLIIAGATHNTSNSADSHLYINDGTGVFNENTQNILDVDDYAFATFVDLDNDGLLDIFQTIRYLFAHRSFFNQGNSTFKLASGSFIDGNIFNPSSLLFDMDNDDDLDMFVYGQQNFYLAPVTSYHAFFINDGTGVFTESNPEFAFNGDYFSSEFIAAADVDNDGDTDLFAFDYVDPQLFINDGEGHFTEHTNLSINPGSYHEIITFFDYNNDNLPDLLIGSRLLQNMGNYQFSEVFDFNINMEQINIVDGDNNGYLDIITRVNDMTSIFYNDGNGTFNLAADGTFTVDYYSFITHKLSVVDFNNDGFLDFVFPYQIFLNNGANILAPNITNEAILMNSPIIKIVDIDSDNDLDVITKGITSYNNWIHLNNGTGVLDEGELFGKGDSWQLFATGDFDNDTDIDMFGFAHYPLGAFKEFLNTAIVTSIQTVKKTKEIEFLVFPNPTNEVINLILTDEGEDYTVDIYNTLGHLVYHSLILNSNKNQELNVSILPKGAYFLTIHSEQKSATQLIIIE